MRVTGTFISWLLLAAFGILAPGTSTSEAQTGSYGYAVAGVSSSDKLGEKGPFGLIGGGFAYPIRNGRLWIAGDVTSHVVNGYLEATGGPSGVLGLGPFIGGRAEPFVQGGVRWGDAGTAWGNTGGGVHVWASKRIGLRLEYQYQWSRVTAFSVFNESGDPVPAQAKALRDQHMLRIGIAIK